MTDKIDPRLDVLTVRDVNVSLGGEFDSLEYVPARAYDLIAAIDAADRAAGIVRVDTNDEALVERIAKVMYEHPGGHFPPWDEVGDIKNVYRAEARAVLAVLREAS